MAGKSRAVIDKSYLRARNVSERKQAGERLQESEEYFRALIENSSDAISIVNGGRTIRYESPSVERVLGYKPKELIGKGLLEFLHPDDVQHVIDTFDASIKNPGQPVCMEVRLLHKDGTWRAMEGIANNLLDDPKVHGIVVNYRDITVRKRAQEQLQMVEENYRTIFENSAVAITVADENENVVSWNKFAEVLLGMDKDDLYMKPVSSLYPEAEWRKIRSQNVRQKGMQHHLETRILRKDQQIIDVALSLSVLKGPDGKVIGSIGVIADITERKRAQEALRKAHDELEIQVKQRTSGLAKANEELRTEITERKRAEEALAEAKRRYKAIFDNRLQMVYINDEQGLFLDANDHALERLEYTRDDLGKVSFQDILHPEDLAKAFEAVADMLTKGFMEHPIELRLITKSGETIWVETFNIPLERGVDHFVGLGIARDITDRKQAEEALQQREQDYLALLETTFEGIVVVDAETLKVVYGNRRASKMFGFDPILKDGVGVNILDLVHPEDKEVVINGFTEDLYQEERRQRYEVRAKTKDGVELWITAFGTRTEFQGRLAVLLSTIDVTERKRAEEALRESEKKFRRLVEDMNDGYCVLQGSRVVFANARSAEMFGYTQEEVIGRTVQELLPPAIVSELSEVRAKRQFGDTVPEQYETTLVSKDGTTHPVELSTRMIDYAGKPALSVVIRDITERKQAEEALRYSEQHFRSLIENAQDAIVILNGDGTIRYESPSMERMMGRKASDRIGKNPLEFSDPDDIPNVIEAFSQLLENQTTTVHIELRLQHKDGSWRTFEVVGNNLLDNPAVAGIVLNLRDITERKQAEEEVRGLNEELEQRVIERTTQLEAVNKELEAFAYSVSHDLRAPLRGIEGFSQVLLEDYAGRLDEEGRDYLQRVRSASQRMAELIDDILSLSRVTRGEMRRETIDLSALAQTIAMELQQSQPERQVEFTITPGLVVTGDAHLLQAALENLLGNAWKFTKKRPRARIEFGYTETNDPSAYFVHDNGVGFDMAYADKLFGAFQRLHSPSEFEGTGIGLATVQRIVHRHGGNIWAESAVDQGATFYFTL